jgi:hypothetical protein
MPFMICPIALNLTMSGQPINDNFLVYFSLSIFYIGSYSINIDYVHVWIGLHLICRYAFAYVSDRIFTRNSHNHLFLCQLHNQLYSP